MLKEEKGITIVTLVITITILLILAGVGTYVGVNDISHTRDSVLSSELLIVQHAILEAYTKYIATNKVVTNSDALSGQQLIGSESYIEKSDGNYYFKYDGQNKIQLKDTNILNYYLLSTEDEFKKLGITNTEGSYVVNYITGEVMNITKFKDSQGKALYVRNN